MKRYAMLFFVLTLWCAMLPGLKFYGDKKEVYAAETSAEEAKDQNNYYETEDTDVIVYIEATNTVCRLTLENYTALALGGVMAEDAPKEALKAQAVALRSLALNRKNNPIHEGYDICTSNGCCTPLADTAYQGCVQAVADTKGQILCHNGAPILGLSHLSSCMNTESYGKKYPYLTSLPVEDESSFDCYKTYYTFTKEAFAAAFPEVKLDADHKDWVGEMSFSKSDRVETLILADKELSGVTFAARLGLDSLCFTVTATESGFSVICYGSGSGYGMSRCSAMLMAAEGKDYSEILGYFYPDTVLYGAHS